MPFLSSQPIEEDGQHVDGAVMRRFQCTVNEAHRIAEMDSRTTSLDDLINAWNSEYAA